MKMEVRRVTVIYVHNTNRSQNITCSDGSQGVLRVSKTNNAVRYNFKFYSHAHLGFWLDKRQFYDGKSLIVKGVLENERLEIKFVN